MENGIVNGLINGYRQWSYKEVLLNGHTGGMAGLEWDKDKIRACEYTIHMIIQMIINYYNLFSVLTFIREILF